MRSVFSLRHRCNLRCVGYLVPQYEASTQYSFSRSDLKCLRYCACVGCAEQLQRTLNHAFSKSNSSERSRPGNRNF